MDLGYPQLPTLLLIDNTVAIGLANDTINKKTVQKHGHAVLLASRPGSTTAIRCRTYTGTT